MSENINLSVILAAGMGSRIDKLQMNKPTSKVLRTIQKTRLPWQSLGELANKDYAKLYCMKVIMYLGR